MWSVLRSVCVTSEISLINLRKGETKAQACEMAWFRQLWDSGVFPEKQNSCPGLACGLLQ